MKTWTVMLGAILVLSLLSFANPGESVNLQAKALASGKLGKVAAAHADYGHTGPDWSAFFYEKGGGSLPDLGVYNLTSLTGLLGPAKNVVALTSIVTPSQSWGTLMGL